MIGIGRMLAKIDPATSYGRASAVSNDCLMNRRRATRTYSPLGHGPALLRLPSVPGNRPESASEEVRQYGLESELPHTFTTHNNTP